ncbi:MAG TPA: hypothetical protein VIL97_01345 [Thermoanaerobaculia bacterium]
MIPRLQPIAPAPRLSPDGLLALRRRIRNLRDMLRVERDGSRIAHIERTLRAAEMRLYNADSPTETEE